MVTTIHARPDQLPRTMTASLFLLTAPVWLLSCGFESQDPVPEENATEVCGRYVIEQITPATEFPARDGSGLVVFNDLLWVTGGWNPAPNTFPNATANDVWLSADGAAWSMVKPNSFVDSATFDPVLDWEGRHLHGAVIHDGSMWIVGGDPLTGHYQNDIWRSEDGVEWRLVSSTPPWAGRTMQSIVAFAGDLWVMGGQTVPQFAPATGQVFDEIWRSEDGVNWEQVLPTGNHWGPRSLAGAAVFKNRMWVIGGGRYNTPTMSRAYYNDVWSSEDGANWRRESGAAPWSPRIFHSVVAFDGRLWLFGGSSAESTKLNDIWSTPDGLRWTQCPSAIEARHAASIASTADAIYIMLGAGQNLMNDVWRISIKPEPN